MGDEAMARELTRQNAGKALAKDARFWLTPNVPNGGRSVSAELVASKGMTDDGQKRTVGLESKTRYWATPTSNEHTGAGHPDSKQGALNLRSQVHAWPTPRGTDGTKGGPNQAGSKGDLMLPSAAAQWPTPMTVNTTSNRAKYGRETSGPSRGGARFGLEDIANTWPTPAARDSKGANSAEHALITGGRKHMDQLSNFVAHSSHQAQPMPDGPPSCESGPASPQPSTKRLNPAFGEWLMGWPVGWTIAEPNASNALETELWRSALQQHLSCLLDGQDL